LPSLKTKIFPSVKRMPFPAFVGVKSMRKLPGPSSPRTRSQPWKFHRAEHLLFLDEGRSFVPRLSILLLHGRDQFIRIRDLCVRRRRQRHKSNRDYQRKSFIVVPRFIRRLRRFEVELMYAILRNLCTLWLRVILSHRLVPTHCTCAICSAASGQVPHSYSVTGVGLVRVDRHTPCCLHTLIGRK
jgi:hypothetical protein